MSHIYGDVIYMVFTNEGFLEVAIESYPEWDLNPQQLNSVLMLLLTELLGLDYISHICMYIKWKRKHV